MVTGVKAYAIPINPEPWAIGSVGIGRNKKTGKLAPFISTNLTLKTYQEGIKSELLLKDAKVLEPNYGLRFLFSRQTVKYTKLSGGAVTRHRADLTNLIKATEDALQGVLIDNDRNVINIEASLAGMQSPTRRPWVVIEVSYGITEYQSVIISPAASVAYEEMRKAEIKSRHVLNNTWIPE